MYRAVAAPAVVSFLLCVATVEGQTILYVDADATGPVQDGSTWCTAYTDLQDALSDAASGYEIRVANGMYLPDKGTGDRMATFQLKNGVAVFGGYAGCGDSYPDERNTVIHQTVLSGDLNADDGPDFANNDENSFHVVTGSGTDATAIIDGLTITGGNADGGSTEGIGGGMHNEGGDPSISNCIFEENVAMQGAGMYNNVSSPTLDDCSFVNNRATAGSTISGGAGMFNYNSDPQITRCTFQGNITGWNRDGGGMQNVGSSPTIRDCTFSDNAGDVGGAMFNDDRSSPLIERCRFINNLGPRGGGALGNLARSCPTVIDCLFHGNSTDASSPPGGWGGAVLEDPALGCSSRFVNCTFSGNTSADDGGAIWIVTGSAEFINCTFSANSADSSGGAFWILPTAQPILTNCILWGNTPEELAGNPNNPPTISFTNIQGGYAGTGNIDADPLFVDADGEDGVFGTEDDDLRLSAFSPCIDAGNNSVVPACARDFDDDERFMDDPATPDSGLGDAPIVDMGAYEFTGVVSDCNSNDVHDGCDVEEESSDDCNGNLLPDECEVPPLCPTCVDCNSNGNPDECDLSGNDCNADLTPDDCQLTSNDCDGNGVPDDCQPYEDCNESGVRDICDIADGDSDDDNDNWIPDECEPKVPTMSEWGMVLMALLVLLAGTVVIRRRRQLA